MTLLNILFLYLAFRAKQVICDFFLQSSWMAYTKVKKFNEGGIKALAMHAAIHGTGTVIVSLIFAPQFWWLGLVDFVTHFIIDKCKALLTNKMAWTYKDSAYWWAFGIDQEAHNLTHLAYIIIIVTGLGTAL